MASRQVFALLKMSLRRNLNQIYCERFSLAMPKFASLCSFGNHYFSTCVYMASKSDVPSDLDRSSEQDRQGKRDDLDRIKQLLTDKKAKLDKKEEHTKKLKLKQPIKDADTATVNMKKFKDMLSSLSSKEETILPSKEQHQEKSLFSNVVSESEKAQDVTTEQDERPLPVDVRKIKDVLSTLNQDHSQSPSEDVMLAGRIQQLSPESVSAMEGVVSVKQRQIRDEQNKKQMPRNSLRSGVRIHWFDDVRGKWPEEDPRLTPTLFQEMAMKEVNDMGSSATVQSGFHDLIENTNRQWSFPIDNETCKREEENVGFDQHVFLEHCLDEFPKSGNFRQFMELVITGLQQNPHLTVKEKKEHIMWFKDYFENIPDELVQI